MAKYKLSGRKCSYGSEYPNCICDSCLQNIVEYDGYKVGTPYTYLITGEKVVIKSFLPIQSPVLVYIEKYAPGKPQADKLGPGKQQVEASSVMEPVSLRDLKR